MVPTPKASGVDNVAVCMTSNGIDTDEPDRCLLVGIQETGGIAEIVKIRIASHEAAIESPVETNPGQVL